MKQAVAEVMAESNGYWHSCTGCHETVDGQETGHYRYSETFNCYQGSGCAECGGIGVIWECEPKPSPAPSLSVEQEAVEILGEELWDKHSVLLPSDISYLDMYVDRNMMTEQEFSKSIKAAYLAGRESDLVSLLKEYNQLLSDECSDLVGVAAVHGWKSSRAEKGIELRKKIAEYDK